MNINENIKELDEIIEQLETLADVCSRHILRVDEAMDKIKKIKESLPASLPPDSLAYKTFEEYCEKSLRSGTILFCPNAKNILLLP